MRKGFTLAEVLITLGILGVVIAMTLPVLIRKHENKVIITELNKTYSELQNIVNLISYEQNDDILNFVEITKEAELNKIFMSYYDDAKDCTENKCFQNQDIKYYTYTGNLLTNSAGTQPINVYFSRPRFITKDGRLFVFGGRDSYSNNSTTNYGQIISVDVNGPFKKPNAWGRDTFSFRIMQKQISPCGGKTLCSNVYNYNCNESEKGLFSGIGCTYYALNKKGFLDKKYYYDRYIPGEL